MKQKKTNIPEELLELIPFSLSPETLEVLSAAIDEVKEEDPDPDEWEDGILDLLADDTGLLDLEEDGEEDPELEDAVSEAAHSLRTALFGKA